MFVNIGSFIILLNILCLYNMLCCPGVNLIEIISEDVPIILMQNNCMPVPDVMMAHEHGQVSHYVGSYGDKRPSLFKHCQVNQAVKLYENA